VSFADIRGPVLRISGKEVAMKVQVAKWGNSTAVRLPKAVVKQLGLAPGMTLDVSIDGAGVKLEPDLNDADASSDVSGGRPEPYPVTLEWIVSEIRRLGPQNAPDDDVDWGPDVGSEVIYDDYNPRRKIP